jgi:hypothetical protein
MTGSGKLAVTMVGSIVLLSALGARGQQSFTGRHAL